MPNLNKRCGDMESPHVQHVSREDTLVNWSLDDFSDIVPMSLLRDDRSLMKAPDEFIL
ncbi:MAG: hypothetical protein ACHBMF_03620 [Chromatiales bacterium]